MERFLVFGHRGSPLHAPENTIRSFEAAFQAGADGIETDLRLLSDRVAVLFHDDDVGEHAIESLTSKAVSESGLTIERLRDLAPFAHRGTLVLEVKRGKWEDALLDEVGAWPGIVIASFDHELIAEVAKRRPDIPLGLTTFGRIVDFASYARKLNATWAFPAYRYVDADLVASLHAAGVRVAPWTPNRPQDWQRLREAGCDGVITDMPGEAVQWRAVHASSRL
jgi:glycerophosphoryl diester phosphodiesterase